MSTGATMTSEMADGVYIGGVSMGVGDGDGEDEVDDEREGESEGDSNDPRERLSAGGGRAMRMSSRPWRASSWGVLGGVCGRRPNSDRADARTGRLVWPLAVLAPWHFRTTG
jgi:hypothetical protein